jgi:predicted ATPase/DNA-binding winged helix-turn-helix (wHTH) protein
MDRLRVGKFELRPSERTLCEGGEPLELGARAFDLLLVLAETPGRLVTKATLLERVWPRLIVDENNLPAQIASLRRVLGAGAIRTVPGFGYRLELEVAPVQALPGATPAREEPQLTPLSVPRRTRPERLVPLVGRTAELREVQEALAHGCLVTLVGTPGVGKTRLAQEVLARAADTHGSAAAWVSLGGLTSPEHVPSAIAVALGVSLPDGGDGFAALAQSLTDVALLLVLDCAEHLKDALVQPLGELLAQTRGLRLLVTSQVPLGVGGERVYRLTALAAPAAGVPESQAAGYPAVAFFAQRARAADCRFELSAANTPLVAEICRRLDGIPLALELAAARVPALGLAALLARLDDRFRLLKSAGRGHDARHGALHAAFDWSYELLSAPEQRVFSRLATFAGSFCLATGAASVADEGIDTTEATDLIGRLVDRSLVTVLAVEPPRYLLLESARDYARSRLQALGEDAAARARMAQTMLALLDVAYQEYWSLDEAIWLHRYEPELANVRAALDWAVAHDRALGVALFGSAWPLFLETDLYGEGRARYAQVLALLHDKLPRARVGRFWESIAAYDSARQCDRARYAAELAAAMYADTRDARAQYYALMQLAANWRVDTTQAWAAFAAARALEEPAWPARLLAHGALTEGSLLTSAGRFSEARDAYQRAMRLALTTSERQALLATVNIVELDVARGDAAAALQLARPLVLSLRHVGRRETHFELLAITFVALLMTGEIGEARALGLELYQLAVRLDPAKLYMALDAMAYLACAGERYADAAEIAACANRAHEAQGQVRRRPAQARMHAAVLEALAQHPAPGAPPRCLGEAEGCALALGLSAG